jgi:hypothetical protein
MRALARWPISPPGTCIEPSCSVAANARTASRHSTALLARSWVKNPTGRRAARRLRSRWPNIVLVHTPVHASWLNQIEVYFSVVQCKLLTPRDFENLTDLTRKLTAFQARYQRAAKPFKWTFTRRDLHILLFKLKKRRAYAGKLWVRNTSP